MKYECVWWLPMGDSLNDARQRKGRAGVGILAAGAEVLDGDSLRCRRGEHDHVAMHAEQTASVGDGTSRAKAARVDVASEL